MSTAKAFRLVFFGLIFAVIAIGLLPFLVVYSWSDLYGIQELPQSNFVVTFLQKFFK
ncbi:hypothetical protein KZ483_18370 [Paenibacillus sp. sptzw28]|uniref:hypothetical protein n=1 Tax=Paenibacillus sp. sptzw28 TaxID=715179 RepID=UPI001C6E26E6|nr:hypothetical protein [Paenibacillus sp. sptzw28]QYR19834.1 hypothetical protein KZ483_18370 [Paenibacillus sp. sptzw28]